MAASCGTVPVIIGSMKGVHALVLVVDGGAFEPAYNLGLAKAESRQLERNANGESGDVQARLQKTVNVMPVYGYQALCICDFAYAILHVVG